MRGIDDRHHLALLCRDLSEIAQYAQVDNVQYRLLKSVTPGPYVFILPATKEVPKRVSHPSRKTIGLRVPANAITQALLNELDAPLLSSTLILPGETVPLNDGEEIRRPARARDRARARRRRVRRRAVDRDRPHRRRAAARARGRRQPRAVRARHGDRRVTPRVPVAMNDVIQKIAVYAIPVIFAITLHEAAHGYVAKYFGDATAYVQGRVSLNPMKHIDPIGTILIPLVLALASFGFVFGYAKPVPVTFQNLRNPKRDMIWVALAGPAANLVQAIVWVIVDLALLKVGVQEPFFYAVAQAGIVVNCVICAFNLVPVPPLDGGRIVMGILPTRAAIAYARIEPYGFFIVIALVVTGVLSAWMQPIVGLLLSVIARPLL